jgi:plasmid stability protein
MNDQGATMSSQVVMLKLPDDLYRQVEQRARQKQHSIEDELLSVVNNFLRVEEIPEEIENAMAELSFLTDEELWQAAQTVLTQGENERMQELAFKHQSDGTTPAEQQEMERLLRRYDQIMLVRAQAVALLKQRGHDVSSLVPDAAVQ